MRSKKFCLELLHPIFSLLASPSHWLLFCSVVVFLFLKFLTLVSDKKELQVCDKTTQTFSCFNTKLSSLLTKNLYTATEKRRGRKTVLELDQGKDSSKYCSLQRTEQKRIWQNCALQGWNQRERYPKTDWILIKTVKAQAPHTHAVPNSQEIRQQLTFLFLGYLRAIRRESERLKTRLFLVY